MKVVKLEDRSSVLIGKLVKIWEDSVKKSHLFLSDAEIHNIKKHVLQALTNISNLIVAEDKDYFSIAHLWESKGKN